ncbi:hypothetical protein OAS06_00410 [Gammaproteobacteria bacterium]|jgi:hypothetical protein|nr:hypothetical protein [Gammaproteobacteria bacterium]
MFRFTEGFIKIWIPAGQKARDIYKPRLDARINPEAMSRLLWPSNAKVSPDGRFLESFLTTS